MNFISKALAESVKTFVNFCDANECCKIVWCKITKLGDALLFWVLHQGETMV